MKYQLEPHQYDQFKVISPDRLPTPEEELTQFTGLQYVTMLDRYALRDNALETLKVGDTVITTVKQHPKYPTQGYGTVVDLDNDVVVVQVQYPEFVSGDDGESIDLQKFKASKKTTFKPLETYWEQIVYRGAKAMASQEKTHELKNKWFKDFYWALRKYYIPAGRILYGAGSGVDVTLFNCFVLPDVGDSRGKIIKHIGDATEIMARGGGVGSNISGLRPTKTQVLGVNGASSGAVSWADYLSKLTHLIEQGGSR